MLAKPQPDKPRKPRKDFPLTAHANGQWCKKIRGKLHYFGPWNDPEAAVRKYLDERDALQAGRTPGRTGGVTVADVCNAFLAAKMNRVEAGELSPRTFANYHATCKRVVARFGRNRSADDLRPNDFEGLRAELSRGRGPVSLSNDIRCVRILFKFAVDADLIARPLKLVNFKAPGRAVLRKDRQARQQAVGLRMIEAADLRRIIATAPQPLRAMTLLGINGGLGQGDCSALPRSAIDLPAGWIDYPRPKTGVPRRIPLWQETIEAMADALPRRPDPRDKADAGLAFLTVTGRPWVRTRFTGDGRGGVASVDAVALAFGRLLTDLGLKRPGLNFYAMRHTFQTIAGESRDQVAVDAVMGHDDGSMAGRYRERIGDDRLKAVTNHVRAWLLNG